MPEKILIIDDDAETLRLIGMMLDRQGFSTISLNNGTQALAIVESEKPDLIVLDVMMPEVDGFQVTRQLRDDPRLMDIPILMFTAKSQVNDKVVGYEAGVDDYLTKPVHPAELVAHIRALLSRSRVRPVAAPLPQKGFVLGVVSPRGGMGVSTLALNLATVLAKSTKNDVIAAELKPGQGTWAIDLGMPGDSGLTTLLKSKPGEITPAMVEKNLTSTTFGVRMLFSFNSHRDIDYSILPDQLVGIVQGLSAISRLTILDIGTPLLPGFDAICALCKEIIVLTEPHHNTVERTKFLLEDLSNITKSSGRTIEMVLYNHMPSSVLLSMVQVSEMLNGVPIDVMIPPVPELAIQANNKHIPLALMQPEGLFTNQMGVLAKLIQSKLG
jgi:CheY-like chemotaxis protein/MinD-like ATPase involved in chromosome partitioning or flagellar assembly